MRSLVPALFLLLLLALPVRAESNRPSFDCDSQTLTALQTLLCEDPVLGAWEGQLAARAGSDGAAAIHQDWLQGLGTECGLAGAGKLPLPARWRAAPCIVKRMRQRLFTQSVVLEPAPAEALPPDGIHPNCIDALKPYPSERHSNDPVPLELCNKGNAHIPTKTRNGFLFADGPAWRGRNVIFIGYRIRGHLSEGIAVVETAVSGGGSGTFDSVLFVRSLPERAPWPGRELVAVGNWYFGDRCNGGLRDVSVSGSAAIETAENITPFDFFTLDDARRGSGWRSARNAALLTDGFAEADKIRSRGDIQLQPYKDLDTSAASCIGTVHYRYNVFDGNRELLGITLERLGGGGRLGACFDAVIGEAAGELPRRFSPGELSAMKEKFRQTCVK